MEMQIQCYGSSREVLCLEESVEMEFKKEKNQVHVTGEAHLG